MIVAGFGFRGAARLSSLRAALAQHGHHAIDALAAPHDKLVLLRRFADTLALPVIAVSPEALRAIATPTRSSASIAARGTGSVAEAAALAAAGDGARLLAPRRISPDALATCAIAEGRGR